MDEKKENPFEKKMERLREIVSALESGDLPLDEGMALYREGVECSRFCRGHLERARHELALWQNGEERPLETFSPDVSSDAPERPEEAE